MDIVERLRLRIHTSEDETALTNDAADEIERLQLREETLSGIIDGMTARFIEAQGAVEEIERLREDREQLQYALMKVCNSLDDNLPAIITKNIALAALGLPLRGMKEDE